MGLMNKNLKGLISVVFLPLSVIACGGDDDNSTKPSTNTLDFDFTLTANQSAVSPSVISSATGAGSFSVKVDTREISGSVIVTGVTPTNVHIHPGAVGESGDALITLGQDVSNANQYNIPAESVLSETDYAKLTSAGLYVNVHSDANPKGEIRGQIIPGNQTVFTAEGDSSQVVGGTNSSATAKAYLLLDQTNGDISGNIQLIGITASNMHIHAGFAGNNGPSVVSFVQSSDPSLWKVMDNSTLATQQRDSIMAGEYYFNVHSAAFSDGEIRGQITTDNIKIYNVPLTVVAGVTSSATGTGYVTLDTQSGDIHSTVIVSAITATKMHIHNISDDSVVVTYVASSETNVWQENDGAGLSANEISTLMSGGMYINVHSDANQAGEISGTIAAASIE